MFGCTDLLQLHVQISRLSARHIRRLSRSTHGVTWQSCSPSVVPKGVEFCGILAPLCLSVCWYICLPVLQNWMSGGGRVCPVYNQRFILFCVTGEDVRCDAWSKCCSRQLHTMVMEVHFGCTWGGEKGRGTCKQLLAWGDSKEKAFIVYL